jgi:myosin-15
MKLDMPIVLEQLRYTGMLETIRIRKTGYPIRLKFAHFVERYRYLLQPRGCALPRGAPFRELCRAILDQATASERGPSHGHHHHHDYQLGTTRVFMRENLERQLEKERADILRTAAITVQVSRHMHTFTVRRWNFVLRTGVCINVQPALRRDTSAVTWHAAGTARARGVQSSCRPPCVGTWRARSTARSARAWCARRPTSVPSGSASGTSSSR